ncbi:MAG: response regulator transcription factor [Ignavibacteriales bacterium]|nr:response regulator transcription factor [Ignavibacteriales bacterium]
MIRTIIIDDENKSRNVLVKLLEKFHADTVTVLAQANSLETGKQAIEEHKPDLVFLDVEMPPHTGFELLQHLTKIDFNVIFVTAHNEYAVNAIRVNAMDYLVKPIDRKELAAAVEKARHQKESGTLPKDLQTLFQRINSSQKKISFPTRNGIVFAHPDEILRCESDSNYTFIFFTNGEKHLAPKTLKEFESLLKEFDFIRIHQSHLVNPKYIKQYIRKGDDGELILSSGDKVEVSRRYKEELMKAMAR